MPTLDWLTEEKYIEASIAMTFGEEGRLGALTLTEEQAEDLRGGAGITGGEHGKCTAACGAFPDCPFLAVSVILLFEEENPEKSRDLADKAIRHIEMIEHLREIRRILDDIG